VRSLVVLAALFGGCFWEVFDDSCIARGTPVATPRGDVNIEDIDVGDVVYAFDPRSRRLVSARVTAVRKSARPCVLVRTVSGRSICATRDHPFLAADGRYRPAAEVARARTATGSDPVVSRRPLRGLHDVYDLSVDVEQHNFVAAGFVVHNKVFVPDDPDIEEAIPAVENLETSELATTCFPTSEPDPDNARLEWVLESADDGVIVVALTADRPIEGLWVGADFVDGYWCQPVDPPSDTVRLRIETDLPNLLVYGVDASGVGEPALVVIR
jgi:hypothetical protein